MQSFPGSIQPPKARILFENYAKIGLMIGQIEHVEAFPKEGNDFCKVTVDFNGRKLTSSQQLLPNCHVIQELYNKQVVLAANVGSYEKVECMILGFPDGKGHLHLLNTRGRNVTPGLCLDMNQEPSQLVTYGDFAKTDIRAAQITSIRQMRGDPNSYFATANLGSLGERKVSIVDIDPEIAKEIRDSQVAVIINIKRECVGDPDSYVLTFTDKGKRIPLGIDRPVLNGASLVESRHYFGLNDYKAKL